MHFHSPNFQSLYHILDYHFKQRSTVVTTESWQGVSTRGRPEMRTYELLNVDLQVSLQSIENLNHWRLDAAPNLPWADVHFEERVCGEPLNPPPSYKIWPWASAAEKAIVDGGRFNHSYPERFWPPYARVGVHGGFPNPYVNYGDLNGLVDLLVKEPHTRQAWIPLFFPEDTGIGDGGRKPCTLGYQFIVRDNKMHIYYPLRSCDFVRHFKDDIYLAIRLLLWVLDQCRECALRIEAQGDGSDTMSKFWQNVKPGEFHMHITSFHVFANDMIQLRRSSDVHR